MHLGDSIFILILALVLLGPKKTAELAQQLGKLMGEFRKASNDFKYQFNEEMRIAEQQEQRRKQEQERSALSADTSPAAEAAPENSILHAPADTLPVPADSPEAVPYAISATTGEEHPVEEHPLLRIEEIPPMDAAPLEPSVVFIEDPVEEPIGEVGPEPVEERGGAAPPLAGETADTVDKQGSSAHHG